MFRKKDYKEYNSYLKNIYFKFNFLDNEVPQGLCIIRNKVYITCYKIDHTTSSVIEYNFDGKRTNTFDLKNHAHVGGISYDKRNNVVFICDTKGRVSVYNFKNFEKIDSFEVSNNPGSRLIERNYPVCSYLKCHNDKLYVGSFNRLKKGIIKVYYIEKDQGRIKLRYKNEFIVPTKIQGLTFYNNYLILSKSYGRNLSSNILVYEYDETLEKYTDKLLKFSLPPMLEQIDMYDEDLVLLFESSSLKYKYSCNYVIDSLVSLDLKKIINNCKNN